MSEEMKRENTPEEAVREEMILQAAEEILKQFKPAFEELAK